jgi:hypothetical protein
LLELIFLPPRDPAPQNWPAWEIPAYQFVSFRLFRFWKGEKKPDKRIRVSLSCGRCADGHAEQRIRARGQP